MRWPQRVAECGSPPNFISSSMEACVAGDLALRFAKGGSPSPKTMPKPFIRCVLLVLFVTKAEIEAEQGLERFSFSMLKVTNAGWIDRSENRSNLFHVRTLGRRLCRSHAANHILRVRPDNIVPGLTCDNLGYWAQKRCIPIGCRQHADKSLYPVAPDWTQPPPSPTPTPQPAQSFARCY